MDSLLWRIIELALRLLAGPRKVQFNFKIGPVTNKKPRQHMDTVTITNEQQVRVTLHPVTEAGHPVTLDGPPTWAVTSGDATVQNVAEDGLSADLVSGDLPGSSTFLITADADLGSGVVPLAATIDLEVTGAMAANLGISVGSPTPKQTSPKPQE